MGLIPHSPDQGAWQVRQPDPLKMNIYEFYRLLFLFCLKYTPDMAQEFDNFKIL